MDYQCKYVVVRKEERTEVMGRGKSGRRAVISKEQGGTRRRTCRMPLLLGWNTATGCDWDVTRTDDTYVRSCPTQVELYWVSTRYIQVDFAWSGRLGELVNFW